MQNVFERYRRFREEIFPKRQALYENLKDTQDPDILFITCSDSRIVPDLIIGSNPGDVFVIRNAGNIVPAYNETAGAGVSATIEFAVTVLKVKSIVVCGHSDCGLMKALLHPDRVAHLPAVSAWMRNSEVARVIVAENQEGRTDDELVEDLIEENVLAQLEHLETHPSVVAALRREDIKLYAWIYKIRNGEILNFDASVGQFLPLDASMPVATYTRRRARA